MSLMITMTDVGCMDSCQESSTRELLIVIGGEKLMSKREFLLSNGFELLADDTLPETQPVQNSVLREFDIGHDFVNFKMSGTRTQSFTNLTFKMLETRVDGVLTEEFNFVWNLRRASTSDEIAASD